MDVPVRARIGPSVLVRLWWPQKASASTGRPFCTALGAKACRECTGHHRSKVDGYWWDR